MNKKLLTVSLFAALAFASCKKVATQDAPTPVVAKTTNDIKAPASFNWESSRNLNFTVAMTDTRFQGSAQLIAIYDGDPAAGGKLLGKGAATLTSAFISTLYISNQTSQVYIVKTAPDNSKVVQILGVTTLNIVTSIGL